MKQLLYGIAYINQTLYQNNDVIVVIFTALKSKNSNYAIKRSYSILIIIQELLEKTYTKN